MNYKEEVKKAMHWLAEQPDAIFLGQSTIYPGPGTYEAIKDISRSKKIEMPVIEESQMGMSIGLALAGFVPITIYPRFDFLILATNQLVNHLDKLYYIASNHKKKQKVIIRTAIGKTSPLNAGPQHTQDHTEAFKLMCPNIKIRKLLNNEPHKILPTYKEAYTNSESYLIIEG